MIKKNNDCLFQLILLMTLLAILFTFIMKRYS